MDRLKKGLYKHKDIVITLDTFFKVVDSLIDWGGRWEPRGSNSTIKSTFYH